MANMSYCRFENTFIDLKDCFENMEDEDLSVDEKRYRDKLIKLCTRISEDYDDSWEGAEEDEEEEA